MNCGIKNSSKYNVDIFKKVKKNIVYLYTCIPFEKSL